MAESSRSDAREAEFATPAKGLVVRSAEGRRLGTLRSIPTTQRKQKAVESLIRGAK